MYIYLFIYWGAPVFVSPLFLHIELKTLAEKASLNKSCKTLKH